MKASRVTEFPPLGIAFLLVLFSSGLRGAEAWWEQCDVPPPGSPIPETIDRLIDRRLEDEGLSPAPQARPEIRLRRVMLDLQGRIPTLTELDSFLADDSPSRWERLVDDLVASPEFDRFLAHEWNWALMDGKSTDFQRYLSNAVTSGSPWSVIFRDSVAGVADEDQRKGVDFYLRDRVRDLDRMTNDVSIQFFGVNISCAQCHDHPYVKDWTQDTYYGMRAFFSRTFENGGLVGERGYGKSYYKTTEGEERESLLRFLGGEPLSEPDCPKPSAEEKKAELALLNEWKQKKQAPPPPDYSRRARLIEVALAEENAQWMARALVNRTWFRLFGHGLVMPLDQMHGRNVPSHPELLQWLALDLVEHNFDQRRLIRGIVSSRAYRRSSLWEKGPRPGREEFAVAIPRPLTPRQYAVALKFGSMRPSHFSRELNPEETAKRIESTVRNGTGLARWFARPGENFQIAVDEALFLSNAEEIQGHLFNAGLRDEILALKTSREKITLAYRSLLSREPAEEEIETLETYLAGRDDRPGPAVEQMLWAIMAGTEARFNH